MALTESRLLATALAREAGLALLSIEERAFEDGHLLRRIEPAQLPVELQAVDNAHSQAPRPGKRVLRAQVTVTFQRQPPLHTRHMGRFTHLRPWGIGLVSQVVMSDLFLPVTLGSLHLANRIVMAPLTRSRAHADGTPTPLMAEYYGQRASAGLIVSEGVNISPQARGYARTPGIYEEAQVRAWRPVLDAVHRGGSRMFLQLWHVGRLSHPSLQPDQGLPIAPSAIRPEARAYTPAGFRPCLTPRELDVKEIPGIVAEYARAARNALAAGFDGVEIHAANGYLIEQFLRDSGNRRTDAYGGSIENRAKFLLDVLEAVTEVCGGGRVGIRLSPLSPVNDLKLDRDPPATYGYVVERLNDFGLAYLHMIEGVTQGPRSVPGGFDLEILRRAFKGMYIANNGYDLALALEARRTHRADLISFGRLYIANPDLVERLRSGATLNELDRETFFGGGAHGYTDYPTLDPPPYPTRKEHIMGQSHSSLDLPHFDIKLRARLGTLREEIHQALLRTDSESYGELAGQVHDVEEESLADLLTDVNLADISREVQEARDIEAARDRIAHHTYGTCIDCGDPIGANRLEAYPTARRCLTCQRAYERRTGLPTAKL